MKKNRVFFIVLILIAVVVIVWLVSGNRSSTSESVTVPAEFGEFKIKVVTTGELEAKKSEKIYGPMGLRNFRIWQVKIEDIIPDGTVVDSGEYVASLDRTELMNKIKDSELDLEKYQTQFTQTQLDTTLEMRTARDNLINLNYALEERQIVVDQSIYEPPATQRQAQIELDKARRAYQQALENYQVKLDKAEANMREVATSLRKAQQEYDQMLGLLEEFTIYAPKSGMVIYRRTWDGQKQGIGATVNMWDPVVAELPNLTEMKSKTYVNEIDISKVKTGQPVSIGVDAFPDKSFTGVVTEVANIGQQLPNSNAKVFEVIIEVNEYDSILRPAMTTKNEVITAVIDSVLFIPLECLHTNDSISFVYSEGRKKQVIPGRSNDNEIIIRAGLEEGEEVYLLPPNDPGSFDLVELDPGKIEKIRQEDLERKGPQLQKASDDQAAGKEKMKNMAPEQVKKLREGGKMKGQRTQKN